MRRTVQQLIEALPRRSQPRRRQVLIGVQNHQPPGFIVFGTGQAIAVPPALWRGLNPGITVIISARAEKPLRIGEQTIAMMQCRDTNIRATTAWRPEQSTR